MLKRRHHTASNLPPWLNYECRHTSMTFYWYDKKIMFPELEVLKDNALEIHVPLHVFQLPRNTINDNRQMTLTVTLKVRQGQTDVCMERKVCACLHDSVCL